MLHHMHLKYFVFWMSIMFVALVIQVVLEICIVFNRMLDTAHHSSIIPFSSKLENKIQAT